MTTIRGRLLAMLLTGLAVVLTAGGTAVYWIAEAGLIRQFDAGLKARAHSLVSLVKLEPGSLVFETSDAPVETFSELYFELRSQTGKLLKRSANLGDASLPQRNLAEHELNIEDTALPDHVDGRAIWLAFRPRVDPDDWTEVSASQADPEVLIAAAAMDRRPVDRALAALLAALLTVGGAVGVAVGVLVAVGVRWGLVPLNRLSRQLGRVSGTTISQRFDDAGAPRELAPIYRELNRMLDRVEGTLDRERSFADAAAHELRTPLAELRTTAEVAIRWPDPERATAALAEILSIGREMERLVESLLLISRGHAVAADGADDAIDVAPIVDACLARTAGTIRDKRLRLSVDLDGNGTLRAPRDAVEIIIRNLIDNAVQYTPSDGSILIRGEGANNGSPSLIVENDTALLDRNDVPRLFEPFWRREGSRSDRQHVGLGLTVVQQIAQAIGLRVDAALSDNHLQIRISAAD